MINLATMYFVALETKDKSYTFKDLPLWNEPTRYFILWKKKKKKSEPMIQLTINKNTLILITFL